jgi:hypothetical protein
MTAILSIILYLIIAAIFGMGVLVVDTDKQLWDGDPSLLGVLAIVWPFALAALLVILLIHLAINSSMYFGKFIVYINDNLKEFVKRKFK